MTPLALVACALVASAAAGVLALSCGRSARVANALGIGGACVVALALLAASIWTLLGGTTF